MIIFTMLSCISNMGPNKEQLNDKLVDVREASGREYIQKEISGLIKNNFLSTEQKVKNIKKTINLCNDKSELNNGGITLLDKALMDQNIKLEIIQSLWGEGITRYNFIKAIEDYKLNDNILNFLFEQLDENQVLHSIKDIIRSEKIEKERVISYIESILSKELNFNKSNETGILIVALELLDNKQSIQESLLNRGIEIINPISCSIEVLKNLFEYLGKGKALEYLEPLVLGAKNIDFGLLSFLFDELNEEQKVKLFIYLIKNSHIDNHTKINDLHIILMNKNLDIEICNREKVLEYAIEFLGEEKIIGSLLRKSINSFDSEAFIRSDKINLKVVEPLFEQIVCKKLKVDCLNNLIKSSKISVENRIEIINSLLDKESIEIEELNREYLLITALENLRDEEILIIEKMWSKGITNFSDFSLFCFRNLSLKKVDFLLSKLCDKESVILLGKIFKNKDIQQKTRLEIISSVLEKRFSINGADDILHLVNVPLEQQENSLILIKEQKKVNYLKALIESEGILKEDKEQLIERILEAGIVPELCNSAKILNSAIVHLGDRQNLIKAIWDRGIKSFDKQSFALAKVLSLDTVNFVLSNKSAFINYISETINNKNIDDKIKLDIAKNLLERDRSKKSHLDKLSKKYFFDYIIEHFSDNKEMIKKIWKIGIREVSPRSFMDANPNVDLESVIFILDNVDKEKESASFYWLIKNKNLSKEKKIKIVDKILDRDLDIEECNNKKEMLSDAIQYMGDNVEIIKKMGKKGIMGFHPVCFANAKYLDIEVINYIFDVIRGGAFIESCFNYLIQNKNLPKEKKVNLLKLILEKDLDIEVCNEYEILATASSHLGDNLEIIEKMWNKGITKFRHLRFGKMKEEVINYIFDNIEEEKLIDCINQLIKSRNIKQKKRLRLTQKMLKRRCFKNLIQKEERLKEKKIKLLKEVFIMENLENLIQNRREETIKLILERNLNPDICNEYRILDKAIFYLGDNLEIIKKIWNKGVTAFNHQNFSYIKYLNAEVASYIFDNISDDKIASCLQFFTQNKVILKEEKINLLDKILETNLPIGSCNKKRILNGVLEYMGDNLGIIEKMWGKGITKFYDLSFHEAEYINLEVINYLFDNIEDYEVAGCFGYLIANKEISREEKAKLVDKILERSLPVDSCNKKKILGKALEYLGDNLEIIEKMWDKGITEFDSFCFRNLQHLDIEVMSYIFNNIEDDKAINCFKYLTKNEHIEEEEKEILVISILDRNPNMEIDVTYSRV